MPIKNTPWDSTEYLKTDADIQAYLDAGLEQAAANPVFVLNALGIVACRDWFSRQVQQGLAAADQGQLLEHSDILSKWKAMRVAAKG